MSSQFLRVKPLNGRGIIGAAAKHNLRELQSELGADGHIDAGRMADNRILAGPTSSGEVVALWEKLMADAGATVKRKDAVRGLEIVFSLPPESSIDCDAFFSDALTWARGFYDVPLLSAVIHKDEEAPHCHVILLPLRGSRLAGSEVLGDRKRFKAMQDGFFESVGERYGLSRPKVKKRLNATMRRKAAEIGYTAIVSDSDLLMQSSVEAAILEAFGRDPEPLLDAMGIPFSLPQTQRKSFVEIMTKPCKPESRSPIGFAPRNRGENINPYPCVEVRLSSASIPVHATAPPETDLQSDFTRYKDDLPAACWDSEIGEFRSPPSKAMRLSF